MKHVIIVVDGSAKKNPGPGGWACILKYGQHMKELSGSEQQTTNNRMEIMAAIKGLEALKEPCSVLVITDSEYLQKGITSWIEKWKRKGWKTSTKSDVLNKDLWIILDKLCEKHRVIFEWTRGHNGHIDNERADELAKKAAEFASDNPAVQHLEKEEAF